MRVSLADAGLQRGGLSRAGTRSGVSARRRGRTPRWHAPGAATRRGGRDREGARRCGRIEDRARRAREADEVALAAAHEPGTRSCPGRPARRAECGPASRPLRPGVGVPARPDERPLHRTRARRGLRDDAARRGRAQGRHFRRRRGHRQPGAAAGHQPDDRGARRASRSPCSSWTRSSGRWTTIIARRSWNCCAAWPIGSRR